MFHNHGVNCSISGIINPVRENQKTIGRIIIMATRKSKRKKKARGFSICLIIIALLLIAGCGLYILKERKTDTTEPNTTPTTTTESSETNTASEYNELIDSILQD